MSLRLALFASGTGTNALNLLQTARELKNVKFELLVVDQVASPLPSFVRSKYPNVKVAVIPVPLELDAKIRKLKHESEILARLKEQKIDWIFLAGYMRIVDHTLLHEYSKSGRSQIVNIHPSLLPAYPGLKSYERAFQAGDPFSGITVHLVDAGMDTGPVLAQEVFKREDTDTLAQFTERGKAVEWLLYSKILKQLDEKGEL